MTTTSAHRPTLLLDAGRTTALLLALVCWTGLPTSTGAPVLALRLLAVPAALLAAQRLLRYAGPTSRTVVWSQRACAAALGWLLAPVAFAPLLGSSPADLPALLSDAVAAAPVVLAASAVAWAPRPALRWQRAGRVSRRVLGAGVPVVLLVAGVSGPALAAPKATPTATATATPTASAPAAPADTGTGVCPTNARTITYELAATPLDIPLNGWGDHLPNGMVYALANADARVGVAQLKANPQLSQPVVIRAAVGDCIKIKLRNDISGYRVGIHPDGLVQFDPLDSDGARIGNNPDTTLGTGEQRTFTWYADHEGEAPVVDVANIDDTTDDGTTVQHGLFGAVLVHPKGSTWHDQVTGADMLDPSGRALETDIAADVHVPGGPSFRSFAAVIMDEAEGVRDRTGQEPTFPTTGQPDATFGINYRSEPLRNRLRAILDHRAGRTITLPNGTTYSPTDHFCDG